VQASGVLKRRSTRARTRLRQIAPAVLLALALGVQYYLSRLPMAGDITGTVSSPPGAEVVVFNAASKGVLLAYAGRPNEAADIRFEHAQLAPETAALLRTVGLEVTDAAGAISWIAAARSASRSYIEVRAANASAPVPELRLRALPVVGASHPQLEVQARGSPLEVLIATPFVPDEPDQHAPKILNVAGRNFELPGAIPLKILVSDGAAWRARFSHPTAPQGAQFALGSIPVIASERAGLQARAVGIAARDPAQERYEYFACAARPGGISWSGAGALTRGRCPAGDEAITATGLHVQASALELDLAGTAWAQQGGTVAGADLFNRIIANPVTAGALLALNLALLAWLLLEVFGARLQRLRAPWRGGVFLSYRREDSAPQAGRLYDHLSAHFGPERVFIDVDALLPGDDFAARIRATLDEADALLAIIGPRWLAQAEGGARRLDDPRDFVRLEIATALERGARVIPVLVGGAAMPKEEELPPLLAPLARRNAISVSDAGFQADVKRLILALEQVGETAAAVAGATVERQREDAVAR
jgi:hypothetical protein